MQPRGLPYLDWGLCRFRCDFSLRVNTFLACILLRAVGDRDDEVAETLLSTGGGQPPRV